MMPKLPRIDGPTERLRIYVGESDHYQGKSLVQQLLEQARREGMAGMTVMRAIEGFGASSRLHAAGLLDLSSDLPLIVEVVDSTAYIERFLPTVLRMVSDGLVTREPVTLVHYHPGESERG